MDNKLTALKVAKVAAPGMIHDGLGLYLQTTIGTDGTPRKSWIYRFAIAGREHKMGLGAFPVVSLKEARDKAAALIRQGINPIEDATRTAVAIRKTTFGEIARDYIAAHRSAWRSAAHARQWAVSLETYAKALWPMPVDEVDVASVLACLTPV
jgi:Arm DNA-binding domain